MNEYEDEKTVLYGIIAGFTGSYGSDSDIAEYYSKLYYDCDRRDFITYTAVKRNCFIGELITMLQSEPYNLTVDALTPLLTGKAAKRTVLKTEKPSAKLLGEKEMKAVKMFKSGIQIGKIAVRLNMPDVELTIRRAYHLGLLKLDTYDGVLYQPRRSWDEAREARLIYLYKCNVSYKDIADDIGVAERTIQDRVCFLTASGKLIKRKKLAKNISVKIVDL